MYGARDTRPRYVTPYIYTHGMVQPIKSGLVQRALTVRSSEYVYGVGSVLTYSSKNAALVRVG